MIRRLVRSTVPGMLLVPAVLAAQTPAAAPSSGNRWTPDPAHSAVTFRVRHLGISWVNGAFRQWTGELNYDSANPEAASVIIRIQTASVDTENERRDNDIKANYLAVDSFPEMTFLSRKVERVAPDRLKITGELTIRGITRPLTLFVRYHGKWETPWWEDGVDKGPKTRAGFEATTRINRHDFGVSWNSPLARGGIVVSDEVTITIDVEAIRD